MSGTPTTLEDVLRARAEFERAVVVYLAWLIYANNRFVRSSSDGLWVNSREARGSVLDDIQTGNWHVCRRGAAR